MLEISNQIKLWCDKYNANFYPKEEMRLFTIELNKKSINIFPIKTTWLNNRTGERGRYRDLYEFLNYQFK